ncbi:hypothetical protein [Yoonia sp. I 8.24]|uniref:hypothetical protein n=1 Tax=Yoonia sp. I 8.24 TaxID=1537229 RepID=UPI001EDC9628|nr:hypothetical protein [Yoonia sp. I 8.24]MCG3269103.1 hypothetical protein [Yoonia sp. I 8.24]
MGNVKQTQGLAQLTDIALQAAHVKMAAIVARETGLRENLAQLAIHDEKPKQVPVTMADAAFAADATVRWQQWVDQRRTTINTELAQVMALKEHCRVDLARAFGRDQAAKALVARRAKTHEARKLRRLYDES